MNRAYRAMEFIGDDLIRRAKEDTEEDVPRRRVWTKSIAIAASLLLIVGGVGFVLLRGGGRAAYDLIDHDYAPSTTANRQNAGNTPAASGQTDVGSKPTTPEIDGWDLLDTMESVYHYRENMTVFAKMKIDEFQGVYKDEDGIPCLSIKCTVVKDYYDTIEDNDVQFILDADLRCFVSREGEIRYYDEQAVIDFLSQFDYLLVYTLAPKITIYSQDSVSFEQVMTSKISLDSYDILPVSDGKLNLHALKNFWIEWDADYPDDDAYSSTKFWNYVQDGLDESVFAEYIRENKERQMNRE